SRTALSTLNTAVLAPMPRASVRTTTVANPGRLAIWRSAKCRSWRRVDMRSSLKACGDGPRAEDCKDRYVDKAADVPPLCLRQIPLPISRLGDLLNNGVAFCQQIAHVAAQHQPLGDPAQRPERGGKAEVVAHLGVTVVQREKGVVVLHRPKRSAQHGVLKIPRRVECGDRAGEHLADAEVPGAPRYLLPHADQAGAGSRCRLLAPMGVAEQVDFDGTGEIEAPVDWCLDDCNFMELDHAVDFLSCVYVSSVAREGFSASDTKSRKKNKLKERAVAQMHEAFHGKTVHGKTVHSKTMRGMTVAALLGFLVGAGTVLQAQRAPKDVVNEMLAQERDAAAHKDNFIYLSNERSERTGGHLWTERVVETPFGRVRLLLAEDSKPLSPERMKQERDRLANDAAHPEAFQKHEQAQKDDEVHARQMLDLLPKGFILENIKPQSEDWHIDF